MKSTTFFRRIWRINAMLILLAGLLGVGSLILAVALLIGELTRTRSVADTVNLDGQAAVSEHFEFGQARRLSGHDWAYLPLESDQSYRPGMSSYDKSAQAVRNLLFISLDGSAHRWLLADHTAIILETQELPCGRSCNERDVPTRAMLVEFVKKDTNGDMRMTGADVKTLALSKPDGQGLVEIADQVTRVVAREVSSLHPTLLLVYESDKQTHSLLVSLADFRILKRQTLPLLLDMKRPG